MLAKQLLLPFLFLSCLMTPGNCGVFLIGQGPQSAQYVIVGTTLDNAIDFNEQKAPIDAYSGWAKNGTLANGYRVLDACAPGRWFAVVLTLGKSVLPNAHDPGPGFLVCGASSRQMALHDVMTKCGCAPADVWSLGSGYDDGGFPRSADYKQAGNMETRWPEALSCGFEEPIHLAGYPRFHRPNVYADEPASSHQEIPKVFAGLKVCGF